MPWCQTYVWVRGKSIWDLVSSAMELDYGPPRRPRAYTTLWVGCAEDFQVWWRTQCTDLHGTVDRGALLGRPGKKKSHYFISKLRWQATKMSLPEGAKMVCLELYADKSRLSSFGTEKGYPVMARIVNLPVGIRNSNGIGGARVVGWLPIVCLK